MALAPDDVYVNLAASVLRDEQQVCQKRPSIEVKVTWCRGKRDLLTLGMSAHIQPLAEGGETRQDLGGDDPFFQAALASPQTQEMEASMNALQEVLQSLLSTA